MNEATASTVALPQQLAAGRGSRLELRHGPGTVGRLRIAMLAACPMPARRGTPLRIERLAEALAARGHEVELIAYHVADGPQMLPVPVHRIFSRPLFWRMPAGPSLRKLLVYDPALAARLLSVAGRRRFDLIHAHHLEGLLAALPARLRYRLPLVYDAHTMLSLELPSYAPAPLRRSVASVGGWLDGLLPRCADHVAAVTPEIRERLVADHGLSPARISVVMNGVELDAFDGVAQLTEEDAAIRILYSGTLAPYQDIGLLLQAFAQARRTRPQLRLVLCASSGDGDWERQARTLGVHEAIELLADDFAALPGRLARARIAVLPRTRCPGIPQKLLNYMAAGKAIVASAGSAKLLEDGRTGLVVPDGDIAAFAAALVRLADDRSLALALGARARESVELNCSWPRAAEQLERIYAGLVPVAIPG